MSILTEIVDYKKTVVAESAKIVPLETIKLQALEQSSALDFTQALKNKITEYNVGIIAEVKKASPSKGLIREDFDPEIIAKDYINNHAACLSILTDEKYFQGHVDFFTKIRSFSNIPLLRKDFMIDPYQIYESRKIGADCILLILAALDDLSLHKLADLSYDLGMQVLLEVHNRAELDRALSVKHPAIIGINNRNLHTFETNLETTVELLNHIPNNRLVVTESGINSAADIQYFLENNIHCFLIGETFMRADKPGSKLYDFIHA